MRRFKRNVHQLILLQSLVLMLLPHVVLARGSQKTSSEGDWTEIIRQTMPAVISIIMYNASGEKLGSGSGFVIASDGIVVTNYHVIQGVSTASAITKQGEKFDIRGVIAFDPVKDFAILKIPAFDLPVVPLGNSNNTEVGESVLAIGDPGDQSRTFPATVSSGIISAKGRELDGSTWLQTSTPVSHGNSGGPLLNRRAEVVGVISRGKNIDGQNFNFAVPINYVRGALQLGTSIKYSLTQLAQAEIELARARAEKKKEEILKLFTPYEDPNGIFKLVVLKDWRVQTARKGLDNGGAIVETLIAPQSAAVAELGGYLSEGIRIGVILPPSNGSFTPDMIEKWKNVFPETFLKGNSGFELTNTGLFIINDEQAKVYTFEGKGQKLPEPEKNVCYVFGNQKAIVQINTVVPISELELLDVLNQLAKRFEFSTNFRTGNVGAPSTSHSGIASQPTNSVTVKDLEVSFRSNLFDETIRNAKQFLEITPNSREAHAYLGLSLLVKKDTDDAATHLQRAIMLGEPITLPVKRLREPVIGHGLDDASVTITATNIIIRSGKSTFQAGFSALSEARIANYNNQCPIVFLKGLFVEMSDNSQKTKQGVKQFNLFPPSATLQPMRQGNIFYNIAVCNDEGTIPLGIIKTLNRVMANQ